MNKTLALILCIGLGLSALIFQLPKGNVSNKTGQVASGEANRDASSAPEAKVEEESHATPLTEGQQKQIALLKSNLASAKTEGLQVGALEKLATAFIQVDKYDSAAYYA
ncbi:MAG: hypothetical protein RIQ70_1624, partial [Bacteroidota bacterium]